VESGSTNNFQSLWDQVLTTLEATVSPYDFDTWIQPIKPLQYSGSTVEVAVPDQLFASWLQDHFLDRLSRSWQTVTGEPVEWRFVCVPSEAQPSLFSGPAPARNRRPTRPRGSLIDGYSFHNFVVGPNNQFARAAAWAVAQQPGTLYNPLFVYGGVGLGKTHLANAVGHAILGQDPKTKVMFASSDGFTNQLIDAISKNKAQQFKNRVRQLDVLIVDDVQFLSGRERTQEKFFHIFNVLYEQGKQIILTSDKVPNELDGIEERLCNRFGWGLVTDVQAPDTETRQAILERKATDEGINLPSDVASYIAVHVDSNIRDLEGALTRITAYASLNHVEIDVGLAKRLLLPICTDSRPTVRFEDIERGVVSHFGLQPGDLRARRRTKKVAEARQVAMYLMRQHMGASYPAIGQFLGGRDHSTVVHGFQTVEKRCKGDIRFRRMLDKVAKVIGCG